MVKCESRPSTIGHITLDPKQTGALSAGNPHAGCDVAGAGDGFTVWLLRHSQRKRGETDRPDLRDTAPVLDPTAMSSQITWEILGWLASEKFMFSEADHRYLILRCHPSRSSAPGTSSSR